MDELGRLLKEWADDFEAAAQFAPTRLQGTVLMTRAQECREQLAGLETALNGIFEDGRNQGYEESKDDD